MSTPSRWTLASIRACDPQQVCWGADLGRHGCHDGGRSWSSWCVLLPGAWRIPRCQLRRMLRVTRFSSNQITCYLIARETAFRRSLILYARSCHRKHGGASGMSCENVFRQRTWFSMVLAAVGHALDPRFARQGSCHIPEHFARKTKSHSAKADSGSTRTRVQIDVVPRLNHTPSPWRG